MNIKNTFEVKQELQSEKKEGIEFGYGVLTSTFEAELDRGIDINTTCMPPNRPCFGGGSTNNFNKNLSNSLK